MGVARETALASSTIIVFKWRILTFTGRNWKCHVIIVIKTDLSGFVVTMHSGLLSGVPDYFDRNNILSGYDLPLARYVKLRVAHAPGMPGTFSPPPQNRDPGMHHGTCVTHVPWCMPGSLTCVFPWSWWRGKRSRPSRRMRNTQFYVSGKRPMIKCLTVLEFSFILFDLCLFITIFIFILNYVPIVTFWIFTYHKIWILLIIFCFIWSYWIIYFLTCLEVFWSVVS